MDNSADVLHFIQSRGQSAAFGPSCVCRMECSPWMGAQIACFHKTGTNPRKCFFFFHPVTQIVRCNSRSFWKTVLDFLLPTTCFSKTCDAHDVNAGTLNSTWPCRKHSQRTGSPVVFWCHNWRDKTLTLHWLCKLTQPEQPKSSG